MTNGAGTKERSGHRPGEIEPAVTGPSIWIRITRWKRGIPARLGLVAIVALGAIAFHVPHPLITGPSQRAGWRMFREPKHGWTVEFPASWHAQRIAEVGPHSVPYTSSQYGILISNIHHRFRKEGPGWTPNFDTRGLTRSLVLVQIQWSYSGGFVVTPCTDTPLPLSLRKVHRSTTQTGANGTSQYHRYLPFNQRGEELYSVNATIGSQASSADQAILEQIVASVSFKDVPAPSRMPGTTCYNEFP